MWTLSLEWLKLNLSVEKLQIYAYFSLSDGAVSANRFLVFAFFALLLAKITRPIWSLNKIITNFQKYPEKTSRGRGRVLEF